MKSLWNEKEAGSFANDPLALRVYTSRLLGRSPSLVLHGGGNTSVKARVKNIFGEDEQVLYVKGSGWDLATIKREGFAPVKMDVLLKMARLPRLSDAEMVRVQRSAMTDPSAPNPSVEAVLHAIIPHAFVDHSHADSVIAITNTPKGEEYIRSIYGDRILVVPYVMPGFILAKKIFDMTNNMDWTPYEGMVLMNHGVFTFGDDARTSYERMIGIVNEAEDFLSRHGVRIQEQRHHHKKTAFKLNAVFARVQDMIKHTDQGPQEGPPPSLVKEDLLKLARLRQIVSQTRGSPVLARQKTSTQDLAFANNSNIASVANRGPLTPDHVIRTKRTPLIVGDDLAVCVRQYADEYLRYFKEHVNGHPLTCLDRAPRWAVWPERGTVVFGRNVKEIHVISDIIDHTVWAIEAAEKFDAWTTLPEKDIFDVEYWELEQAKLKKGGARLPFEGQVALVTGAASGIGRACVETLYQQGAAVVALDINPSVERIFDQDGILDLICDVTHEGDLQKSIEKAIAQFGGIDILVSNAGIFPAGESIEHLANDTWHQSLDINLSSHQRLLRQCIPFLERGVDPAVIIIASKNVPAPGPGASAYSVAKAGLTQLARVAALELAPKGIRVNVVHPNQVFDTGIWTPEVLAGRARQYGMSVEDYKTSNLLKTEITSNDVARLVATMAGPVFSKTTGAQVPIDGGNERVI